MRASDLDRWRGICRGPATGVKSEQMLRGVTGPASPTFPGGRGSEFASLTRAATARRKEARTAQVVKGRQIDGGEVSPFQGPAPFFSLRGCL